MVISGVLRPLEVTEAEVLALVRTTEPELYSLVLACRGCEHAPARRSPDPCPTAIEERQKQPPPGGETTGTNQFMARWLSGLDAEDDPFDFGQSSSAREDDSNVASPIKPLVLWDQPASVIALVFQRAEAVLEADTTRRSTVLCIERVLLNLGYPDVLRGAERLGGEMDAVRARGGEEGYRRLAAAAREFLQDWRIGHEDRLESLRPRALGVGAPIGSSCGQDMADAPPAQDIEAGDGNSNTRVLTEDEQPFGRVTLTAGRPTIARYAVHRPRLAAAAHRLASCWRPEFHHAATESGKEFPEFVSSGNMRI